jgi:hypothetical protein
MKTLKIISTFSFFTFLFLSSVQAERKGDQGLGAMLGNPTGLTWKMWLDGPLAVDAAVGVQQGELDGHATLLWHGFDWLEKIFPHSPAIKNSLQKSDIPIYVGIGPRILFEDKEEIGIRIPVGISVLPHNSKWEFFAEVAPVFRLTPDQGVDGDMALGVRYYFPAIRPRGSN